MDDSTATAPTPSTAAAPAAGYDAARDKTNADVAAAAAVAANSNSSSSSIRLLIKSSNQQYDDMNIESDLCWTVQRLKKQLSLVYPGKPAINDQKLIYSGKLLDDAQKLSEVIRSYKDVYQQHHIFHLVCVNKQLLKPPQKPTTTTAAASKEANATTASSGAMPHHLETNTNPTMNPNANDNELRQRHVAGAAQLPYQQAQQVPFSQATAHFNWMYFQQQQQQQQQQNQAATLAGNSGSQIAFQQQQALLYNAWMQQWYAAYMQQMLQRSGGTQTAAAPTLPPLHPFMQHMPVIPNNLHGAPQQPIPAGGATAAAAAAAAVAVAAQPANEAAVGQPPAAGGQVEAPNYPNVQEEPEMRDWLDSFFSFIRLAIFITVLYFNSSPLRCLMVVLIASVIYLYHIGVLRRRRERNNNNINRNNNAGNNDAAAFAAVQQIQRMMDAAVEPENPQGDGPVPAAEDGVQAAVATPEQDAVDNGAARPAGDAASDEVASAGQEQANAAVAAAEAVVVEPANANNSVISIVRTFVITFFTSLLPEAPAL